MTFPRFNIVLVCLPLILRSLVRSVTISPLTSSNKILFSKSGASNIRTLLIDNYDSYTYNIWQLLTECNNLEPIVVFNDDFHGSWDKLLESIPNFDNIIISPGPGSPDVRADFGLSLDAILRADVPVLGVCLGHQGMAHAFGGQVTRAVTPMHGRMSAITHLNTGVFQDIPQYENVVRYHSLVVGSDLPSDLIATAWTNDGTIMGLQHVLKPLYGVQFHPESIATNCGKQIFSNFHDITTEFHRRKTNRPHWSLDKGSKTNFSPTTVNDNSKSSKSNMDRMNAIQHSSEGNIHQIVVTEPLTVPVALPVSEANSAPDSRETHIQVSKFSLPSHITIESVFKHLYGNHSASFWLDSSDIKQQQQQQVPPTIPSMGNIDRDSNSNRGSNSDSSSDNNRAAALSFMGAIDTPGAFVAEYWGNNSLSVKSYVNENTDNDNNNSNNIHLSHNNNNNNINNSINMNMNIFEFLEEELQNNSQEIVSTDSTCSISDIPFEVTSALFGFLGYEARHDATKILTNRRNSGSKFDFPIEIDNKNKNEGDVNTRNKNTATATGMGNKSSKIPVAMFMLPTRFLAIDHSTSDIYIIAVDRNNRNKNMNKMKENKGNRQRNSGSDSLSHIENIDDNSNSNCAQSRINDTKRKLEQLIEINALDILSPPQVAVPVGVPAATATTGVEVPSMKTQRRLELRCDKSKSQYLADIRRSLEYITQGETYEVCLTAPFRGPCPRPRPSSITSTGTDIGSSTVSSSPLDVYCALRQNNPAPYSSYIHYEDQSTMTSSSNEGEDREIDTDNSNNSNNNNNKRKSSISPQGGFSVCCSSPERFLKASQSGVLESKPIKGTVKRVLNDAEADKTAAVALAADEKSRSENLMIVDLVRNDLGRVCSPGSVTVPSLMHVETYASVHQLVSSICGKLQPGRSVVDALVATFPGGSMTGAPKLRTMDIISELEGRERGVYSGAIGYIGMNGAVDLNIVIRTAIIQNEEIVVNSGGAIVALSCPEQEVEEILLKAAAVSASIGYSLVMDP
eukprot:gene6311-12769_t